MLSFRDYLLEANSLDRDDIKQIVLNALGLNPEMNDRDYLASNLSNYNNRGEILHAQAIRNLPFFDEIKRVIDIEYRKYTIGTLIDYIDQLTNIDRE